jgi:ribosomal protein S27AE
MSPNHPTCPECGNHDQVASQVIEIKSKQKTQTDGVIVNFSEEPKQRWSCKRCTCHFSTPV